jgi:hypothetical protein
MLQGLQIVFLELICNKNMPFPRVLPPFVEIDTAKASG